MNEQEKISPPTGECAVNSHLAKKGQGGEWIGSHYRRRVLNWELFTLSIDSQRGGQSWINYTKDKGNVAMTQNKEC